MQLTSVYFLERRFIFKIDAFRLKPGVFPAHFGPTVFSAVSRTTAGGAPSAAAASSSFNTAAGLTASHVAAIVPVQRSSLGSGGNVKDKVRREMSHV